MAKRIGTVVVFKEGTTKKQAADALRRISDVVYTPEHSYDYELYVDRGQKCAKLVKKPFEFEHKLQEYEEDHGEPVWYIP